MGVNDTAEHDVCVAVGYDLCDLAFEMRFGLGDANGRTVAEDAGCQMTGDLEILWGGRRGNGNFVAASNDGVPRCPSRTT